MDLGPLSHYSSLYLVTIGKKTKKGDKSMNTTTSAQCEICNDKGVIWSEVFPGTFKSGLCICHTPEYWAEQSTTNVMLFKQRIAEIRENNGGENGGKMEHAGRQEHQLF